jgi:hypothetical protein
MGLIYPLVNGEFYIDNDTDYLWLREDAAWTKKGKLVRANVVGLWTEGPFPYTDFQAFELARSETSYRLYSPFSDARSYVIGNYPTAANLDVILTNDLGGFLQSGRGVVCVAHFTPASQIATLTFTDTIIPAFAPLWIILPSAADITFAGLQCIFGGEPV